MYYKGLKRYLWEPLCAVVDTPSLEYLCNASPTIMYALKYSVFTLQHNIQSLVSAKNTTE